MAPDRHSITNSSSLGFGVYDLLVPFLSAIIDNPRLISAIHIECRKEVEL
jgi:hypothetical protein